MRRSLAKQVGSLIGIGGVAFSITLLSQSMRAVEAVGGTCASGGPYAISRPCPQGVAGALPLAIIGGLIFLGLFVFCASDRGRSVAMLAWSALFLTLAWNFIDYGLKGGTAGGAGFLIPGVLFVIMGAAPLFYVVPNMWKAFLGQDPDQSAAPSPFLKYAGVETPSAGRAGRDLLVAILVGVGDEQPDRLDGDADHHVARDLDGNRRRLLERRLG